LEKVFLIELGLLLIVVAMNVHGAAGVFKVCFLLLPIWGFMHFLKACVVYNIAKRFNENVPISKYFIPIIGAYHLARQVMPKPHMYCAAMLGVATVEMGFLIITADYDHYHSFASYRQTYIIIAPIILGVSSAFCGYHLYWIGRALGNKWNYYLTAFFSLPLLVVLPILFICIILYLGESAGPSCSC
jgi:hypothetical protein